MKDKVEQRIISSLNINNIKKLSLLFICEPTITPAENNGRPKTFLIAGINLTGINTEIRLC